MYKKDLAPKDITRLKEAVLVINKLTGNEICADCQASRSLWASVNFGVFLCSECAGLHRGLGVHITQVRSVTLDDWTPSQVFAVLINGNLFVNYHLLRNYRGKPLMSGDGASKHRFIHDKYDGSRFGSREGLLVVNRDTFPSLSVNDVLEFYNHALAQYRKNIDHVTVRHELIKLAGYQNMERIAKEPHGIHLRVPELSVNKASLAIVNKKPIFLSQTQSVVQHITANQQENVQQQPAIVKDEQNFVDLDFGEMTSAPPVKAVKAKRNSIGFGQPVTKELESKIDDLFSGLSFNNGSQKTSYDLFNGMPKIVDNDDWPTIPSGIPKKSGNHGFDNSNNVIIDEDLFANKNGTNSMVNNAQSIIAIDLFSTDLNVVKSMTTSNHSVINGDLFGSTTSDNQMIGTTNSTISGVDDLFANLSNSTSMTFPAINNSNTLITNDLFMNPTPLTMDNTSPVMNSQQFPAFNNSKPAGPGKVAEDRDFILSLFKN